MKKTTPKSTLARIGYFLLVVALTVGMSASAFGATSNKALTNPLLLIGGDDNAASKITITEDAAGILEGTITLETPAGVTFASDPNASFGSLNSAASTSSKKVWDVDTTQKTDVVKIEISEIALNLDDTVAEGDVALTITSEYPGNPGLTEGDVVVGTATAAEALATLSGSAGNAKIGGTYPATGTIDITIQEATGGSIADGSTISIELPAGVSFNSDVTISSGTVVLTDPNATGDGTDTASWEVQTASGANDPQTITLSSTIEVADSVTVGDINATITAGTALSSELTIAKAKKAGVSAKVTEDAPQFPAGRDDVSLASIKITENFIDDLDPNATLAITFSDDVTITAIDTLGASNVDAEIDSAKGFNVIEISVSDPNSDTAIATLDITGLEVSIADGVAAGDLVATLSGEVNGEAITAVELVVGEVVDAAVEIEANDTIGPIGVGSSGSISEFTITEVGAKSLAGNTSTITVELPAGVTWKGSPTAISDPSDTSGGVEITKPQVDSAKSTATFKVLTTSTKASTITISGEITLASTVAIGDIEATVGGNAGADGAVVIANAANALTIETIQIPVLEAGVPTQTVAALKITEAFPGAFPTGSFRLLTSDGVWLDTSKVDTISGSDPNLAITVDDDGTNEAGDTLVITSSASSSVASTFTISGLKMNVSDAAADGEFMVELYDGDMNGDNTTGLGNTDLFMGFIGDPEDLTADPEEVTVDANTPAEVTIAGGLSGYTAVSDDEDVATVSVDGDVVTITAGANSADGDTATITVTDNGADADEVEIDVTIGTPVDYAPVNEVDLTDPASAVVTLELSTDNSQGITPAQEWLLMTATIGGNNAGIYFFTTDGELVPFDPAMDPATVTFEYTSNPQEIVVDFDMASLLSDAGDSFVYAYVYSEEEVEKFTDGGFEFGQVVTYEAK